MQLFVLLHTLLQLLVETQGLPNIFLRNTIVPRKLQNIYIPATIITNQTLSTLDIADSPHNSIQNLMQESLLRPPEQNDSLSNEAITSSTITNVKNLDYNSYILSDTHYESTSNEGSEFHIQKHIVTEKVLPTNETQLSKLIYANNTETQYSNSDFSFSTPTSNVPLTAFDTTSTVNVHNTTKSSVFRRSLSPEYKVPESSLTKNTSNLLTTENNSENLLMNLSETKSPLKMYSDMDIGPFHIPKSVLISAQHKYEDAITFYNKTKGEKIIDLSISVDSRNTSSVEPQLALKTTIVQNTSKTTNSYLQHPNQNINQDQHPTTDSPQMYKPMKSGDTFEVTETGDFGGFSVTKTEEVELSKLNISKDDENSPLMVNKSPKIINNQSMEHNDDIDKVKPSDSDIKKRINNKERNITMKNIALLHISEINHKELDKKANINKDVTENPTTEVTMMTSTLSNIFDGDLIPPIPNNWHGNDEQQWKEMYWENSDSSEEYSRPNHIENKNDINTDPLNKETNLNGKVNNERYLEESQLTKSQTIKYKEDSEEPPYEMESDTDIFPFHIPQKVMNSVREKIRKENSSSHLNSSASFKKINETYSKHDSNIVSNMASKISYIAPEIEYKKTPLHKDSNSNEKLYDFSANKLVETDVVPEVSLPNDGNINQDVGIMQTEKAAYHKRLGDERNKPSPWPVNGDPVELVTVRSSWPSLWSGPLGAPKVNSTSEHVYSVYWSQRDTHEATESLTMGIWIIRAGSLFAVATLIITIVVQVVRGDPYVHSSVPPSDPNSRAHLSQRATLTTNLATSLAAAHVLFILGIQAPGSSWICGVVGLLLHFLHLVSCCWLLLLTAGLLGHLHRRPPLHTAVYCALAWTASLAFVVVSYAVNPEGYETRHYCWMSVERGMLISFIVPVCTLIMINAGLCVAAQKVLLDMRDGVKHEVMERYQRSLRAAVCLLPFEGVSWFIGVVAIEDDQSYALDVFAAAVNAFLGWLVLYFYGSSWSCHGPCWLRHYASLRRTEDNTITLSQRYEADHQHQPLLHQSVTSSSINSAASGTPIAATPTKSFPSETQPLTTPQPSAAVEVKSSPQPSTQQTEEFPLQPIFPGHERPQAY